MMSSGATAYGIKGFFATREKAIDSAIH
jgi:hypothetical protein